MRTAVFIGVASVVLGVGTTAALALTSGGMGRWRHPVAEPWQQYPAPPCAVPTLPGSVVDVTVTDMGAMMGRRHGGMGAGMMRLVVNPASVPAGRYELVCNIAGHYSSRMYTELDVT